MHGDKVTARELREGGNASSVPRWYLQLTSVSSTNCNSMPRSQVLMICHGFRMNWVEKQGSRTKHRIALSRQWTLCNHACLYRCCNVAKIKKVGAICRDKTEQDSEVASGSSPQMCERLLSPLLTYRRWCRGYCVAQNLD